MRHLIRRLAAGSTLAALAAAVAVSAGSAGGTIQSGGVLRIGWEQSFGFTDNFDPTGEYLGDAIGIYSSLLVRTLVGYNHVPGPAGNKVIPDLATTVPQPTNGGKTYTFHLKPGVKFGPPLDRTITSKDVLYALERLAKPRNGAQYAFYYSVIKGFDAYGAGKARSISGIKTPNASTIVFNLTEPTGDFLMRLSMPAAGPIPVEVAKCFDGHAGRYGRDLVSTGPYMIAGMDKVDASSCKALKAASGFDGQTILDLVRNPSWDPKTDSKKARAAYADEVRFTVDSSADDIFNKIEAGQLDMATSTIPPAVLRKYATTSSLKPYFHQDSGDRTWYITMNLTAPPFDDVHVRRALNWVADRTALVQAWGGPTIGAVANHIVPDTLFDNQLAEFAPYKTPGDHGSAAKAKVAMKGSKYDTKGDGTCSAPECKNVLLLADTRLVDTKLVPVLEADAAKIGITFKVRIVNGAYPTLQTVANNIPISERPGWGKDYGDALTFFEPLFASKAILPTGNPDYALVGLSSSRCKELKVTGNCDNVPSIDSRLAACSVLAGKPRLTCYENLDRYLTTQVVPWVPYLWSYVTRITSTNVTHYQFDQFATTPAYANIAVK